MEVSQSKQEIQKKINNAFQAFGMEAENCIIETEKAYSSHTADKKLQRWAGGSKCVRLTEDIQSNSYLTEFAAHCIAASVKNNNHEKSISTFYGIGFISPFLPSLSFLFANNASYGIPLAIAFAVPVAFLGTKKGMRILDQKISDYFDAQAFQIACQKLIEQNNLKPLATYYAFAKMVKHCPLSQKDQLCTIKWVLKNNHFTITSARTNYNSMRAHIWEEEKYVSGGEYTIPNSGSKEDDLADFNTSDKLGISFINA